MYFLIDYHKACFYVEVESGKETVENNFMKTLPLFLYMQSCLTLYDPMDCSPQDSSVPGIFLARILKWVTISFSRGSSQPRTGTHVSCISCIDREILYLLHYLGSPWISIWDCKIFFILLYGICFTSNRSDSWKRSPWTAGSFHVSGDFPVC